MALFQIPGWSVSAAPVREEPHQLSKKRKRQSNNTINTGVSIERLVSKLAPPESGTADTLSSSSKNLQGRSEKKQKKKVSAGLHRELKTVAGPKPNMEKSKKINSNEGPAKAKKRKEATQEYTVETPPSKALTGYQPSSNMRLTTLQKGMKEKLDGARFRIINEDLYKSDSRTAHKMMQDHPRVFEEYHTGFRHQVLSWPSNPVQHYISSFASYPKSTVIADLGCGDAALAKCLLPKGVSVISFDLVSDDTYVVEADICHRIPLPGSEGAGKDRSTGEGQIVDVVVCALSLMGINWVGCLREAWRILKIGGELHIAEVTSRFTDIQGFENLLDSLGFRLKVKDGSSSHFILFEFIKAARSVKTESEWDNLLSKGCLLKPCEYKRR